MAHPGVCDSNLGARTGESGKQGFLLRQFVKFATGELFNSQRQSQEDGACGILSAACLPEVQSSQMWSPKNDAIVGPAVPSSVAACAALSSNSKLASSIGRKPELPAS